ncbi:hypothetical protein [Cohnella sp. WQ 127256]|uniref:hypothetical protein n=1 Tax=Cohnella sp. WQ 127256 TaxID=2938790 RepID=UPI002118C387|nr:hypothetical protein [Cohnella sp. WQ 127256]
MYSILQIVIYFFVFILFILSWFAGSKASRLLYGGSSERQCRKTRKQMVWAVYVTLPAIGVIITTLLIASSKGSAFWELSLLLHLPLTIIPLLAIWLLSMPRLWKLWSLTRRTTIAPLPVDIRKLAGHPWIIVPFQMSALGAATVFYFLIVTPDPLHLTKAIIPIVIWAATSVAIWFVQDRRWQRVARSSSSSAIQAIPFQALRRALRVFGIF